MQSIRQIGDYGKLPSTKNTILSSPIVPGLSSLLLPMPISVDSRWAFDIKDESPPRYKARFVAKGFSQRHGINYEETYAPVVKPETLRVLFAVAAHRKYLIHGMDAVTAFLNSILKEIIYVKQAKGFINAEHPDWVYLLGKALYGLKQSTLE